MASQAQLKAQRKYDKAHTQSIMFKLNRTNDADIIARLNDVSNKQGYVKNLIRQDIRGNTPILSFDALRYLIQPVARRNELTTVYLFGSYARGEATQNSDIDLMIDGSAIDTADRYFYIKNEFQKVLGKNVDLVMASAAKRNKTRSGRRFLDHFEKDKVLLYEQL